MTPQDITLCALTAFREARGGRPQPQAMTAIINVIQNRSLKHNESPYKVCTEHEQFTAISVPGTESCLWGNEQDSYWQLALELANEAATGTLLDVTNGSTLYYAPHAIKTTATFTLPDGAVVPFPQTWNPGAVKYQVTIGSQIFLTEA